MTQPVHTNAKHHLLFDAAERGSLADVKYHLAQGADPDATVFNGRNALMAAAANDRLDCVAHLLPLTQADSRDARGWSALMIAACYGSPKMLRLWADRGGHSDQQEDGLTPLMLAIIEGNRDSAAVLIKRSNLNQSDDEGQTALHHAAYHNQAELCVLLAGRGDPNRVDDNGDIPLALALKAGCFKAAMALIPLSDARQPDADGSSPQEIVKDSFEFDPTLKQALLEALGARLARQEREELDASVPQASPRQKPIL